MSPRSSASSYVPVIQWPLLHMFGVIQEYSGSVPSTVSRRKSYTVPMRSHWSRFSRTERNCTNGLWAFMYGGKSRIVRFAVSG